MYVCVYMERERKREEEADSPGGNLEDIKKQTEN